MLCILKILACSKLGLPLAETKNCLPIKILERSCIKAVVVWSMATSSLYRRAQSMVSAIPLVVYLDPALYPAQPITILNATIRTGQVLPPTRKNGWSLLCVLENHQVTGCAQLKSRVYSIYLGREMYPELGTRLPDRFQLPVQQWSA